MYPDTTNNIQFYITYKKMNPKHIVIRSLGAKGQKQYTW